MSTLIKTLVLNNNTVKNYKGMAVLTLTQENANVYGTFKAYNLDKHDNLVLGIAGNKKQILKQNINLINNNTYSFKLNNFNLSEPISCVLVANNKTEVIPLIWANSQNDLKNEIMQNFAELKAQSQTLINNKPEIKEPEKQEKLDLSDMFDISNVEEIEDIIDNELEKDEQLNNETELTKLTETLSDSKNPIEDELKNYEYSENTFYESMSEQIEDLFNKYPAETNLEGLIPNSKWVKIDYENNGNFYVLGLIYEDVELKYICYGVPGKYAENPPNGLDHYSQFLPVNPSEPNDGYWVMYQNAINGESVDIYAI